LALFHYIDNEVPGFGEWDSVVADAPSTVSQSSEAAFPGRGATGLRFTVATNYHECYAAKANVATLAPGEALFVGLYHRTVSTSGAQNLHGLYCAGSKALLKLDSDGRLALWYRTDSSTVTTDYAQIAPGWNYLVLALRRATGSATSDGSCQLYCNGALLQEAENLDNYDTLDGASLELRIGPYSNAHVAVIDVDEIKLADAYPQPFAPEPVGATLSPERTALLIPATADGWDFAAHCIAALGLPQCNVCALTNLSGAETLASYEAFRTEVEDAIAAFDALHPTVAQRRMALLLGPGIPGGFLHEGTTFSATSRLMHYPAAFSPGATNPLYRPATPERLTHAALGGLHLCTRVDAATLGGAMAMIDRAGAVSALPALPPDDALYSDSSELPASQAAMQTRMALSAGGSAEPVGLMIASDPGALSPPATGSRCLVAETGAALDSLRGGSSWAALALSEGGYACGLGFRRLPAGAFDAEAFVEMLRIGGTFAEAVAVSVERLDDASVAAGSPLLTIPFQHNGYNVYRGEGDVANVDFSRLVACLRPGQTSAPLPPEHTGGHAPDARYVYVVRPVVGGIESADVSCVAEFVTEADGNWLGARPAPVEDFRARAEAGGRITLTWRYRTPPERPGPAEFVVYHDLSRPLTFGEGGEAAACSADGAFSHTMVFDDGEARYFAVTARTAEGAESAPSPVLGPVLARSCAPATPFFNARPVWR
jgi:hypothetical protein